MKRYYKMTVSVLTAVAIAAASLTACSQTTSQTPVQVGTETGQGTNTIVVSSRESVQTVPDKAVLQFSVVSQGDNAAACRDANTADVNAVLAYLTGQGISEESIQTSDMNMSPRYDWTSAGNQIVGYEMSTSISVSDIEIDQLGSILNAAVEAGINSISGASYQASNYDEAYQEALKKAIEEARVKAEAMAETAGVRLGEVVSIVESSSSTQSNRYAVRSYGAGNMVAESAAADMSIMPGTVEAEADIQVTFRIQ